MEILAIGTQKATILLSGWKITEMTDYNYAFTIKSK